MTRANEMNTMANKREMEKIVKRTKRGEVFAKNTHYTKIKKAAKKGKKEIKVIVPFKSSPISAKATFSEMGYKVSYVKRDMFDRVIFKISW